MTISEFLERFETKFKAEKPEIGNNGDRLRIATQRKEYVKLPSCPLEYVAESCGVANAMEVLDMTLSDASKLMNAADWLRAEPQLRESLMRIMGLQEKP